MTNEQAERLLAWLQTTQRLAAKTDDELADLLVDHVWANLPLGSPQSDLVAEVIHRLKKEPD